MIPHPTSSLDQNKQPINFRTQVKSKINKDKRTSIRPITIKWINTQNNVCKKIVKQNGCFCTHSYGNHQYHYSMKPHCKVKGCKCECFEYSPHFDIKCLCKHSFKNHDPQTKKCRLCTKCTHFLTSWACKCGFKYHQHETKIFQEWDKQYNILPNLSRDRLVMNGQNSIGYHKNVDVIDQRIGDSLFYNQTIETENFQQNLSQNQKQLKNILKSVNNRVLKLQSQKGSKTVQKKLSKSTLNKNSIAKENSLSTKDRTINKLNLQNIDYAGTNLQLILTPHKYRFTNVYNFINKKQQRQHKLLSHTHQNQPF